MGWLGNDGLALGEEKDRTRAVTTGFRFVTRVERRKITRVALLATDGIAIVLGLAAATSVFEFVPTSFGKAVFSAYAPGVEPAALIVVLACMWFAYLALGHLYDPDDIHQGSGQFARVFRAVSLGMVTFVVAMHIAGLGEFVREWVVSAWLLTLLTLGLGRLVVRDLLGRVGKGELVRRSTLIVGSNQEAADITVSLAESGAGLTPVGYVSSQLKDQLSLDYVPPTVPKLGSPRDIADVVRANAIDTVLIIASAFDYEVLDRIIADLRGTPVSIRMATGLSNVLSSRVCVGEVSGIPLIGVKSVSLTPGQLTAKRTFDVAAAGLGVLLLAPLWGMLALLIKSTSRGPVFYRQERVGENGQPFLMYKFRSMVCDAEDMIDQLRGDNEADGPLFKIRQDPRVTPLGRWMRRYSLDEFPQLINVLKGDMSLVGPRPPLPGEAVRYDKKAVRRLEVVPGMTGLWQVSGRSDLTFEEMIQLDLFYIENWSVFFDVAMVARTIPAVFSRRGAY